MHATQGSELERWSGWAHHIGIWSSQVFQKYKFFRLILWIYIYKYFIINIYILYILFHRFNQWPTSSTSDPVTQYPDRVDHQSEFYNIGWYIMKY